MSFEIGKNETVDRLIAAGRTLLAQGDTKFTVVRLCAEARVGVEEFRRSFGNKSALFKAMLETPEAESERPLIEDMWVERRLRNFERALKIFEERISEAKDNHARGMMRLEEKLEKISRQNLAPMREPVREQPALIPAPQPVPEQVEKETAVAVPNLREPISQTIRPAPDAEPQLARLGPQRLLMLAALLFITLASLAGAALLYGAHGKMTGRATADQSASVQQMTPLIRRAESGDAKAQSQLAFAYLRGSGVKRDIDAAVRWSREAAAKGEPDAEYLLGSLMQSGTGLSRDPKQAFAWFQRSADAGNVKAMHNLAIAYIQGNGTPKDAITAATWFARAAASGYVDSAFDLAVLYEQGLGVQQNEQQALHWYRVAANAGDRTAATRAHMLETAGHP
jgi:AcrR family transcriptional regulator